MIFAMVAAYSFRSSTENRRFMFMACEGCFVLYPYCSLSKNETGLTESMNKMRLRVYPLAVFLFGN